MEMQVLGKYLISLFCVCFYLSFFFVETKAYQLLKQSITQENQWQSAQKEEEEEDGSDLEPSGN